MTPRTSSGSCLCGSVRYTIAAAIGLPEHCHCSMCRKAHGAAFSTNATVPTDSLVVEGREHLSEYASSPGRLKQFCSRCGSQLFIRRLNAPGLTVVTLGTLDDDPCVRPGRHVFVGSKAAWYDPQVRLPAFDVYPAAESEDSSTPVFQPIDWTGYSAVDVACDVARHVFEGDDCMVLRVRFIGECGGGAGSNGDAVSMEAMLQAAMQIVDPDGLIVDCSELRYEWGDLVATALHVPYRWRQCDEPPFAIVVGPGCEAGLRSLLLQELEWSPADMARVFGDLDRAHGHVERIMQHRSAVKRQEMEAAMRRWPSAGDPA